jgi:hypothetical protein
MTDYVSLYSDFDEFSDDDTFDTIYDASDDLERKLPGFKNTEPAMWLGRATIGMLALIKKQYPSAFTYETPNISILLDNKKEKISYMLTDENENVIGIMTESDFIKNLNLNNNIRHTIIDINRKFDVDSDHSNNLIIDKKLKIVEFFEPHGYSELHYFFLEQLRKMFSKYDYKVISPTLACIRPPQGGKIEKYLDDNFFKTGGWCMFWNGFYLVYRMLYPDIPSKEILRRMTKGTEKEKLTRFFKFLGIIEKIQPSEWTKKKMSSFWLKEVLSSSSNSSSSNSSSSNSSSSNSSSSNDSSSNSSSSNSSSSNDSSSNSSSSNSSFSNSSSSNDSSSNDSSSNSSLVKFKSKKIKYPKYPKRKSSSKKKKSPKTKYPKRKSSYKKKKSPKAKYSKRKSFSKKPKRK